MKIVGRIREQAELSRHFHSGRPEFIAVTGRRRIGKTYLVKELFSQDMAFYFSGAIGKNIDNAYQLRQFDDAVAEFGGESKPASSNWADAFGKLRKLLKTQCGKRQVVFIDELPWLDAPKSDFLPALDYFWNTFASARADIMLVVCGSSASWIVKNLFENKGGLHNRVTGRIWLAPFSLAESEAFFNEIGVMMNRYQIAESLMVFGGVPYYLNMFEKSLGPTQNIDRLLFSENAPLKNEFNEVYRSLFRASDRHMLIASALSKTKAGMTRDEIIKAAKIPGGGNLTRTLGELEQCGFIEKYSDFTKPKNNAYYRLIDPFTLYWLKYVKDNRTKDDYYWTNLIDDGGRRAWSGYAFELLCLRHLAQIKQKLGISGISTEVFSWRSKESQPGAQIDLLISRRDGVINLCEMKYSLHPVTLTAKDDQDLQRKRTAFLAETGTRKAVHVTMVTTYGLTEKGHTASVQSEVALDDLFR
ncbi:MAG: ATP-binding protein [Clostridiales bacterium]|nr:ATP-binding protein [Clostridiales bacterium]